MVTLNAETLRAYAIIFEADRRDPVSGQLRAAGEISQTAAYCLRLVADQIEGADLRRGD